jgi:hypothetical protein
MGIGSFFRHLGVHLRISHRAGILVVVGRTNMDSQLGAALDQ